ncbi:hypothetical protein J0X19_13200 [Hymenobacter sp. BT186]|uniref:Septum formation inhibitor Maf n=1 Tax=Hymenobacter telluris TaxID=2816474 RepID=A0A939EWX1_9BACT|nr:hypothetical protein [Hymenobacter telluris]MBO0358908.1 hypothetical protein [Hymenobacter telluris]MBW3374934.1 hypothetical protein [Hymenobacter norwichensis]
MRYSIRHWPLGLGLAVSLSVGGGCSSPEPAQVADKPTTAPPRGEELPNALRRLAPEFNPQWAMDTLWEDGLAEVAVYNAERVIYDEVRQFEYVQLTVKEEFNQQYKVKTDDYQRPDLFPVMKVNQFCRIPTDQYPYHFLTSLFFRRENPVGLYKLTTSSQEWCGNTFKAFQDDGLQYMQTYNSYWDGQGVGRRRLRRDVLFEDALPYTLRSLRFDTLPTFKAAICELQQTSKAGSPVYYNAEIQVREAPAPDTPEPAWLVRVQLEPKKVSTYWFARKYPNVLLRQDTWDGRKLTLKKVSRYAYWTHPAPDSTQAK